MGFFVNKCKITGMKFFAIFLSLSSLLAFTKDVNLMIIRGMNRGVQHTHLMEEQIRLFEKNNKIKINVYNWDIPGNGRLHKEKSFTSIESNVEHLRKKFLESKLDKKKDLIMFAVSLGGMIGTKWLESYPGDFSEVYLANTSFQGACGLFDRLIPKNIPGFVSTVFQSTDEKKEEIIYDIIINRQDKRETLIPYWSELRKKNPVSPFNTFRQIYAGMKFSISEKKPHSKIKILVSENDKMVSSKCSKEISRMWKVPISIHPTAGHDILNDDLEWVLEEVTKSSVMN